MSDAAAGQIDPFSGYGGRGSLLTVQEVDRFRDIGMPLDDLLTMVEVPMSRLATRRSSPTSARMETQLEQTQSTVASLRHLIEQEPTPIAVDREAAQ